MFGRSNKRKPTREVVHGYRSEDNSSCSIKNALSVLYHDIYQSDDPNTGLSLLDGILQKWDFGVPGMEYPKDSINETTPYLSRNFVRIMLAYMGISEQLEINYAIWLCSNPITVVSRYGVVVDTYDVTDACLIYDDGNDNLLYGFEQYPNKINSRKMEGFQIIK